MLGRLGCDSKLWSNIGIKNAYTQIQEIILSFVVVTCESEKSPAKAGLFVYYY
jgi:hypothetical protein